MTIRSTATLAMIAAFTLLTPLFAALVQATSSSTSVFHPEAPEKTESMSVGALGQETAESPVVMSAMGESPDSQVFVYVKLLRGSSSSPKSDYLVELVGAGVNTLPTAPGASSVQVPSLLHTIGAVRDLEPVRAVMVNAGTWRVRAEPTNGKTWLAVDKREDLTITFESVKAEGHGSSTKK